MELEIQFERLVEEHNRATREQVKLIENLRERIDALEKRAEQFNIQSLHKL